MTFLAIGIALGLGYEFGVRPILEWVRRQPDYPESFRQWQRRVRGY